MKIQYLLLSALLLASSAVLAQVPETNPANKTYNLSDVDQEPVFSKGRMTARQFLDFYLQYPQQALENKVEGVVMLTFTIQVDGEVTDARVLQGVDPALDAEAMRVAGLLPYYTPGFVNGEPVATKVIFPVAFAIAEEAPTAPAPATSNTLPAAAAVTIQNTGPAPLFIVDGTRVDTDLNLDANKIATVRVIKGSKALELYGPSAADGVVIIRTKTQ